MSLELKWNKTCVITSQQIGVNLDGGNITAPTNATLAVNDSKLYIPAVTLSKDDEIKLSGFTRILKKLKKKLKIWIYIRNNME